MMQDVPKGLGGGFGRLGKDVGFAGAGARHNPTVHSSIQKTETRSSSLGGAPITTAMLVQDLERALLEFVGPGEVNLLAEVSNTKKATEQLPPPALLNLLSALETPTKSQLFANCDPFTSPSDFRAQILSVGLPDLQAESGSSCRSVLLEDAKNDQQDAEVIHRKEVSSFSLENPQFIYHSILLAVVSL